MIIRRNIIKLVAVFIIDMMRPAACFIFLCNDITEGVIDEFRC